MFSQNTRYLRPSTYGINRESSRQQRLKLQLSDGSIQILLEKKRILKNITLTYYYDPNQEKEYIIKNTKDMVREYLGSTAYRALGVTVPDFFLAKIMNKRLKKTVVIIQELFDKSLEIDPDSSVIPLSQTMPSLTHLVTVGAVLGDRSGHCFNTRHVKIAGGKIYKLDNSEVFNHLLEDPNILFTKLFNPDMCTNREIALAVKILAHHNFELYNDIIENFFATFNSEQLTQQIFEACSHEFFDEIMQQSNHIDVNKICSNIASTVHNFSITMRERTKNSSSIPAIQSSHGTTSLNQPINESLSSSATFAPDQYPTLPEEQLLYYVPVPYSNSQYPSQETFYLQNPAQTPMMAVSVAPTMQYTTTQPHEYYYGPYAPENYTYSHQYNPYYEQAEIKASPQQTVNPQDAVMMIQAVQQALSQMQQTQQHMDSSMKIILRQLRQQQNPSHVESSLPRNTSPVTLQHHQDSPLHESKTRNVTSEGSSSLFNSHIPKGRQSGQDRLDGSHTQTRHTSRNNHRGRG